MLAMGHCFPRSSIYVRSLKSISQMISKLWPGPNLIFFFSYFNLKLRKRLLKVKYEELRSNIYTVYQSVFVVFVVFCVSSLKSLCQG